MEQNPNSITQVFDEDKEYLLRFRRVLPKHEQGLVDELITFAQKHMYAVAHAGHPLPFVMSLVAMVVEQQKEIRKLEEALKRLKERREG
jgi:hypothetical protein